MRFKGFYIIFFFTLLLPQTVYSQVDVNSSIYGTHTGSKFSFKPDSVYTGNSEPQASHIKNINTDNSFTPERDSLDSEQLNLKNNYKENLAAQFTPGNLERLNSEVQTDLNTDLPSYDTIKPDLNTSPAQFDDIKSDINSSSPIPETSNAMEAQVSMEIKTFEINESLILTKEELNDVTRPFIGKLIDIETLNEVVNKINTLYLEKGYITAKAYLPEQKVQNGSIKINLVEGKVGDIVIEGNKWTRSSYIKGKISQKPDVIFDLNQLEKDIMKFNRENAVKLRASIKPGKVFGTSDIYLIADDKNPFHFTPTFDNTGRENIGVLRGGTSFTADSLLGYRDQFTMGYSRARSTDIAFSSYNFPIGNRGTRVGGSFAFSNIKISSGPFEKLNIEGNSYNYSGYVSQQFISTRKIDFSGDLSVNFRQVTTFFDEFPLYTTQVRSLVAGLNFQYRDNWGYWSTRHAFANGLDLLGGNVRFFKYNGYATRVHNFGHGIIGIFRGALQLSDDMLPPVEQFQIGGSTTVRGYSEGLLIGDNGYLLSAEIRFPLPFLPKQVGKFQVRDRIRGLVFCDHGGAFPDDGDASSPHHYDYLTSVGMGLRGYITKYISGRIDWGFGLGQREWPQPTARMHFGLEANPI